MTLIVPSITLKSSIIYNKEKDGIAINNKIKHGINVQIISRTVLCCTLVGNKKILLINLVSTDTLIFKL
jgi:hypothetical protein